jgi:hypothetical protein
MGGSGWSEGEVVFFCPKAEKLMSTSNKEVNLLMVQMYL